MFDLDQDILKKDNFQRVMQKYLDNLTEEAQSFLLRSIETSRLKGKISESQEAIIAILRDKKNGTIKDTNRIITAERSFFEIVEPFLINANLAEKHRGLIMHSSLRPIWIWLTRDLAHNALAKTLNGSFQAAESQNLKKLNDTTINLRLLFNQSAQSMIQLIEKRHGSLMPLAAQLGNQRIMEDLFDILDIFRLEQSLRTFKTNLPKKNILSQQGIKETDKHLRNFIKQHKKDSIFAFVILNDCLPADAELVRLATKFCVTDSPGKIRQSDYSHLVSLSLSRLECLHATLAEQLQKDRNKNQIIATMEQYNDIVRALQTELDLDTQDPWGKRLAALKTKMSDRMKPEIQAAAHVISRPFHFKANQNAETPVDEESINNAELAIAILNLIEKHRNSYVMHSLLLEAKKAAEQALEISSKKILDALSDSDMKTISARNQKAQVVISLCSLLFDEQYGAILDKKRQTILQKHKDTQDENHQQKSVS